ncbi:DUF6528 family protein [Bacteroidota bacterium]
MRSLIVIAVILLKILPSCNPPTQTSSYKQELIVCGWDEVYILDMNSQEEEQPQKIWTWRGADRSDLPESYKSLFKSTDECKPFDQGNKILITSSGGGVAYVDRKQDRVLCYCRVANAHSADLLPNNRIAVAASHAPNGDGDRLIIFDINLPDKELWSEELSWGHGVVWDEKRQLLYALSGEDIRIFKLNDWESDAPKLDSVSTVILPERGGHDFYPVPATNYLSLTTGTKCWLFDRDTKEITPHPDIAEKAHVKCISQHPITKQIVYVQAEGENWWAERLHFLNPDETYYVSGEHFYKVRWNIAVE